MLDKSRFDGITFIDIDKGPDWSFPDYNCTRVPRQGDIMKFDYIKENDHEYYFGKVLYIVDKRTMYGEDTMQDCEIKHDCVYVVMREIKPEMGNALWKSLARIENLDKLIEDE
jgi:hypothetical protein